jgi:hypothetical protein
MGVRRTVGPQHATTKLRQPAAVAAAGRARSAVPGAAWIGAHGGVWDVAQLARLHPAQRVPVVAGLQSSVGNQAVARLAGASASAALARMKLSRYGTDSGAFTFRAKNPCPPHVKLDAWCAECLKLADIPIGSAEYTGAVGAGEKATLLAAEFHAQNALGTDNEYSPFLSVAVSADAAAAAGTIVGIVGSAEWIYEFDVPDQYIVKVGNAVSRKETEVLIALPKGVEPTEVGRRPNPHRASPQASSSSASSAAASSSSSAPRESKRDEDNKRRLPESGEHEDYRERSSRGRGRSPERDRRDHDRERGRSRTDERRERERREEHGSSRRERERDDRRPYSRSDKRERSPKEERRDRDRGRDG